MAEPEDQTPQWSPEALAFEDTLRTALQAFVGRPPLAMKSAEAVGIFTVWACRISVALNVPADQLLHGVQEEFEVQKDAYDQAMARRAAATMTGPGEPPADGG